MTDYNYALQSGYLENHHIIQISHKICKLLSYTIAWIFERDTLKNLEYTLAMLVKLFSAQAQTG